jgi:hypothetical protein
MKLKAFTYVIMVLVLFTTCKKTKLRGEFSELPGTYYWNRGWGDGGTHDLKLDLKERGKYKLFRGKLKIEHGRLLKADGYLKFISEKLINNKNLMLDNKQIVFLGNDTINITRKDCENCAFSTFKKSE